MGDLAFPRILNRIMEKCKSGFINSLSLSLSFLPFLTADSTRSKISLFLSRQILSSSNIFNQLFCDLKIARFSAGQPVNILPQNHSCFFFFHATHFLLLVSICAVFYVPDFLCFVFWCDQEENSEKTSALQKLCFLRRKTTERKRDRAQNNKYK